MNDNSRFDTDGLSSAWLHFTSLADELPECPHRESLRQAADIANSLSNLRSAVSEIITGLDEGKLTTVDAARELRRAMEETAKGGDDGSNG